MNVNTKKDKYLYTTIDDKKKILSHLEFIEKQIFEEKNNDKRQIRVGIIIKSDGKYLVSQENNDDTQLQIIEMVKDEKIGKDNQLNIEMIIHNFMKLGEFDLKEVQYSWNLIKNLEQFIYRIVSILRDTININDKELINLILSNNILNYVQLDQTDDFLNYYFKLELPKNLTVKINNKKLPFIQWLSKEQVLNNEVLKNNSQYLLNMIKESIL